MAAVSVSPPDARAADPRIRVVVADDSAAIRTLARHALSAHHGFEVVAEASNGLDAVAAFESLLPDCVVLDVEMPGMGGFEALAELHRRSPTLPVILLTGHSDPVEEDRALRSGAVSYLNKSTSLTRLAATVRRVTSGEGEAEGAPAGEPASPAATATEAAADLRRLEYVVSHDLGEPLRIMSGFATLLDNRYAGELDDSARSFLGHIVGAAARMQTMLDDLLGFSRAGRLTARSDPVDLDTVVHIVYQSLEGELARRHAVASSGSLPRVDGDRDLLVTVLRQLVLNAVTFNRAERPSVRVDGRVEGLRAVITVADNGIGIADADRERAFELFRRLGSGEEYPGTGTGLALCRRLVTLQGGTIDLEAHDGTGTTVRLVLPAHRG